MRALIAVIEDEEDLLELLEYNLTKVGFEVVGFPSTKNVKDFLEQEEVDLMIVDRNLPDTEGSKFIHQLREKDIDTPVIFLSAKGKDTQIEEGFLRGGDDYMAKPFNMNELIFRVKAILKRTKPKEESDVLKYRDIEISQKSRKVFIESKEVSLTKLEFELLLEFIKNKNIVLNRDQLLDKVWGKESIYQDKTVNVAIKRLKEKIDPSKDKNYIESIRGIGYKLC